MIGREIQNYRIEELIGEGGMGTVYRAIDVFLARDVALKMLHPNLVSQSTFYERFRNEAQILAKLNHPNIATLHNFLEDKGDYFMVMEFIEGADLEASLKSRGAFSVEEVLQIIDQTLTGLSHAHQKGVFHRDLKPANLILSRDNQVKIMDFGIAKMVNGQKLTQVNRLIGTLEYLAPELLKGAEPSIQSDLYAIGIIIYELLSGKMPYKGETDYDLMQKIINESPLKISNSKIPPELQKVVMKLLQKNPDKRYGSAMELKAAIGKLHRLEKKQTSDANIKTSKSIENLPKIAIPKWEALELFKNKTTLILAGSVLLALLIVVFSLLSKNESTDTRPIADLSNETQDFLEDKNNEPALQEEKSYNPIIFEEINTPAQDPESVKGKEEVLPERKKEATERKKEATERKKEATEKKKEVAESEKTPPPKETPDKQVKKEPVVVVSETKPKEKEAAPQPESREPEKSKAAKSVAVSLNRNKVVVALDNTVISSSVISGDRLSFTIVKPVQIGGKTVFARGGKARGIVSDVKAKSGIRKESLEIRISDVQAANGQWIPVKASIFRQVASSLKSKVEFVSGQQFVVETAEITINVN